MTQRAPGLPRVLVIADPDREEGVLSLLERVGAAPVVRPRAEASVPDADARMVLVAVDPRHVAECCAEVGRWASVRVAPVLLRHEYALAPELAEAGAADFIGIEADPKILELRLRMGLRARPPLDPATAARLDLAMQGTRTGLWDWRVQTGEVAFSEEWAGMLGYSLAELEPLSLDTWREQTHPEDLLRAEEALRRCFAGEVDHYSCEIRMRHRVGRWIWVLDRGKVIEWGPGGLPIRMVGTHVDITELKEAERTAAERDALYRAAVSGARDSLLLVDARGKILDASESTCRQMGYSRAELLSLTLASVDAETAAAGEEGPMHTRAFSPGEPVLFETALLRKDGSTFPAEVRVSRLGSGDDALFLGFIRDLTTRKQKEALLRAQSRLTESSFTMSSQELLRVFLDEAEALTGSSIAFFHLVDPDQEHVVLQEWSASTRAQMGNLRARGVHHPISKAGVWADCLRALAPVVHNDYESLPHKRGLPGGHVPVVRELVVPVLQEGRIAAILGVGNKATDYVEADVTHLSALARDGWQIVLRRQAQEQAQLAESRYADVIRSSPDGFFAVSASGTILEANSAYAAMLGYTESELPGREIFDLTEGSREVVLQRIERTRREGSLHIETRHRRKDGSWVPLDLALRYADTDGGRLLVFARDATDRVRILEDVRRSHRGYQTLVENSPDIVLRVDDEGRILFRNRRLQDYGVAGAGTVVETLTEAGLGPSVIEGWERLHARALGGEPVTKEAALPLAGGIRHFDVRLVPEASGADGIRTVLVMARDVTEQRKLAEDYLELFLHMGEGVALCQIAYDGQERAVDVRALMVNPSLARILGRNVSDLEGESVRDLLLPERGGLVARLAAVVKHATPAEFHAAIPAMDSFVEVRAYPTGGLQLAMVVTDITERRRAERSLRDSEERLRGVFDHAPVGIFLVDLAGTVLAANPAFTAMVRRAPHDLVGADFQALLHPSDQERARAVVLGMASGRAQNEELEVRYLTPEGGEVWGRVRVAPIRHADGEVSFLSVMVEDLTRQRAEAAERHQLEARLRQAQKMEAIGTLAGGIAHDFNNILAAILGYSELAYEDADGGDVDLARKDLSEVLKAGRRAKDLVAQILAFSRQGEQQRRPLRLSPIVKEALKLLRASLPTTIEIRTVLEDDLGTVEADATQIHQVVMNLCTNAFQAMRESGGILEVSLAYRALATREEALFPELGRGRYAVLSVKDTGPGMDAGTLARAFEPYFTTKTPGEGTGLGLATVHGIATSHGGAVEAESSPGRGATFHVFLPVSGEAQAAEEGVTPRAKPRGRERILFVDDEPAICKVAEEGLARLGYQVRSTLDPRKALAMVQEDPEAYDAVITDLTMPGMTGIELSDRLLETRADLPVILCSGYADTRHHGEATEAGVKSILAKPLTPDDMAEELRRILDGAGA